MRKAIDSKYEGLRDRIAGHRPRCTGTESGRYCRIRQTPFILYYLVAPGNFYRYYRYRVADDCIEVRRGVIFRSHALVPVERIHQVQVTKGPILRKFVLANVTMTTAVVTGVFEAKFLERVSETVMARIRDGRYDFRRFQ